MEFGRVKLSKKDKHIMKKQQKLRDTVLRHENITCCHVSTKHLIVANAGLGNGVSREQLWLLFAQFGDVSDILMKPGKPYAFVSYSSTEEATAAMSALNGQPVDCSQDSPHIYLQYVEQCPESMKSAIANNLPPGLTVIKDYVSIDEEQRLLSCIQWDNAELLKHRRVLHYGYKFMYDAFDVDRQPLNNPIPSECCCLLKRLYDDRLITQMPDQLTVNEYLPGQGIPPHVDTHSAFEDAIIIVTLNSQVVMEFRKRSRCGDEDASVVLPYLSVAIMPGESRYGWTHGITPRTTDIVPVAAEDTEQTRLTLVKRSTRTSLTFRTVRQSAVCNCNYIEYCDSQKRQNSTASEGDASKQDLTLSDTCEFLSNIDVTRQLEDDHVHQVYESIAEHFSETRHRPWPRVVQFINQIPAGSLVVDVGCGNGKYFGINPNIYMVGCDRSHGLCEICHDRGYESLISDSLSLPIRDAACNAVLCIAVIHHLSTADRRLNAIQELVRLLSPGGRALIYVWAFEQQKHNINSKYLKSSKMTSSHKPLQSSGNEQYPSLPVHVNGTPFQSQDILVPWHLKESHKTKSDECVSVSGATEDVVFHRYYHTFVEGELDELCQQISSVQIIDSYYDQGNWCVIIERLLHVQLNS